MGKRNGQPFHFQQVCMEIPSKHFYFPSLLSNQFKNKNVATINQIMDMQMPGKTTPISKSGLPSSALIPFGNMWRSGQRILIGMDETNKYHFPVGARIVPPTVRKRHTSNSTIIPKRSLKNKSNGISHNWEIVRTTIAIPAPRIGTQVVNRMPPKDVPTNIIIFDTRITHPI